MHLSYEFRSLFFGRKDGIMAKGEATDTRSDKDGISCRGFFNKKFCYGDSIGIDPTVAQWASNSGCDERPETINRGSGFNEYTIKQYQNCELDSPVNHYDFPRGRHLGLEKYIKGDSEFKTGFFKSEMIAEQIFKLFNDLPITEKIPYK
jgi:hypothetical protein